MKKSWAGVLLTGVAVVLCSCRRGAGNHDAIDVSVERSDAELRRLLGFGQVPAGWMESVDSIGRRLAVVAGSSASQERKIAVISEWMNSSAGVQPQLAPNDTDLVPSLAWQRHRGGCTALAWIWMRLGKAMELELQPVLLPGHLVLRADNDRFVETLRGGLQRPRAFYDSAFSLAKRPAYRLDAQESSALEAALLVHRGLLNWKRQNLNEAEILFRRSSIMVPGLPEAEGNLGLVLLSLGRNLEAQEHLAIAVYGDSLNLKAEANWKELARGGDR